MKSIWNVIVCAVVGVSTAMAGIEGGNTEIFRPVNSKGQPIEIQFSGTHPLQDKLTQLITGADLPPLLKGEILGDLTSTAVMYSSEIVTYADTQRQVALVLSKITKTTGKDANGNTTSSTQEEYTISEAAAKLNLHIAPMNIVINGLADSYVAAYTQSSPRRVVYFNEFIRQMGEEELLHLVLHEQAHRLSYLKPFKNDERFIEAWSAAFLNYLLGKTPRDQFFAMLMQNGLPVATSGNIPGEEYLGDGKFRSLLNVTVSPDNVGYAGLDKAKYIIQARRSVFKDYPALQNQEFYEFQMSPETASPAEFNVIDRYIMGVLGAGQSLNMQVELTYSKELTTDSTGRKYTILKQMGNPQYMPKEKKQAIYQALTDLTKKHWGGIGDFSLDADHWAMLDPETSADMQGMIARVGQALDEIKAETPTMYELLKKRTLYVTSRYYRSSSYDSRRSESTFAVKRHDNDSKFLSLVLEPNPANKFARYSVVDIKAEFLKSIWVMNAMAAKTLEPINALLASKDIIIYPSEKLTVEDAALMQNFLASSPMLQGGLACLSAHQHKDGHLALTVSMGDDDVVGWHYERTESFFFGDEYLDNIVLKLPRKQLEENPRAVEAFVKSVVLTWEGAQGDKVETESGKATWDPAMKSFRVTNTSGFTSGYYRSLFQDALQSCTPTKPNSKPKRRGD